MAIGQLVGVLGANINGGPFKLPLEAQVPRLKK